MSPLLPFPASSPVKLLFSSSFASRFFPRSSLGGSFTAALSKPVITQSEISSGVLPFFSRFSSPPITASFHGLLSSSSVFSVSSSPLSASRLLAFLFYWALWPFTYSSPSIRIGRASLPSAIASSSPSLPFSFLGLPCFLIISPLCSRAAGLPFLCPAWGSPAL